jgi:general secretion pathway protein K
MRDRGFALVIVLWSLGLLALLGCALTATARNGARIARNTGDAAVAEAAADGGLQRAIFMVQQSAWPTDGSSHTLRVGEALVEVRATDQLGRLNPNETTVAMLEGLLVSAGAEPSRAASLAKAIVDWRIRGLNSLSGGTKLDQYRAAGLPYSAANRPFHSIDELGLVLGMSSPLLARLEPRLSIYPPGDVEQPLSGTVAAWTSEEEAKTGSIGRNLVATIVATARLPHGARFARRAVVRFNLDPGVDPCAAAGFVACRNRSA